MNKPSSPWPLISFWFGLAMLLPAIGFLALAIHGLAGTLFDPYAEGLGQLGIIIILPILVIILGLLLFYAVQLYRRKPTAIILEMCAIPWGVYTCVKIVLPASWRSSALGYGAASSLAISLQLAGMAALIAAVEYVTYKDLHTVRGQI